MNGFTADEEISCLHETKETMFIKSLSLGLYSEPN
jgi:hypothetical protein